ncbi:ScbA/BarX family gamma-butyrolactone biosynthesis protein [Streptomyces sp. P9(2023)]|uniref:ScbA/BarX family gamma-butyrolactone biosynthesis protein n=1 Tax=Streptomyces sp. P9(2023) TaxID=3064394 RepID=UPI0028F428E5|nr:ScbA/BarX family gamma-butyrolactone biosynthesis protein [Streptomyces sp. P9(2023)]MDT9690273.1 ScbA/BarX family gamma-butyrolactone biosynthesis protein [Streptomyces sp. P9(2023)]
MPPIELAQDRATTGLVPVPMSYTHKTNPAEVLLASWCRTGDDTFTVTARWPHEHAFYLARHGRHDPLFLAETVRQTLPLLSHAAYDVPFGHQLLWKDFGWDIDPDALRADGTDAEVELHIAASDVKYRKERATAVTLSFEAVRAGRRLATARTRFTIQDRAVYERLRGRYADIESANARALPLPPPSPTQQTGRTRFEDVVLSCTDVPHRWQLRTDTSHPVLFDHPVDHAPGMLLLEAARQAAQAAAHPRQTLVVGMECDFSRYAELDAPCWITAGALPDDADGRPRMLVTAEQNNAEIFTSVVALCDAPAEG